MSDSDPHLRIPKGILKNKYVAPTSSNTGPGGESSDQIGMHAASYNYGRAGNGNWDAQLGMSIAPVPVPAPQHGINMSNPVLDPIIRGIK